MIEVFGTIVLMFVIAVVVGEWTHSLGWGLAIAGFGVVGSALSLYYRSKEQLDVAGVVRTPERRSRPGSRRILEADLELPDGFGQGDVGLQEDGEGTHDDAPSKRGGGVA